MLLSLICISNRMSGWQGTGAWLCPKIKKTAQAVDSITRSAASATAVSLRLFLAIQVGEILVADAGRRRVDNDAEQHKHAEC